MTSEIDGEQPKKRRGHRRPLRESLQGGVDHVVPEVVGMAFESAMSVLVRSGLRLARVDDPESTERRGTVVRLIPPAGSTVDLSNVVQIVVAWPPGRACPCCSNLTMSEGNPGSFEICPVCFWEDDGVQNDDPTYAGGANVVSLNEARHNYQTIGVTTRRSVSPRSDSESSSENRWPRNCHRPRGSRWYLRRRRPNPKRVSPEVRTRR